MVSEAAGVGLVGARGFAGRELLRLVADHPRLELAFAASRSRTGQPIREGVPGWGGDELFVGADPEALAAQDADVVVLALPNGASDPYVAVIGLDTLIVDLSADHRFDDGWVYGLPELHRGDIAGASRIANPGCYATAAMLALAPLIASLDTEPAAFGVSGFTGAGTEPSPRNDPELLRDNVMPYRITGHGHEREISHQLGRSVRFAPSVAPFDRGLVVTVLATLREPTDIGRLSEVYRDQYRDDALIEVVDDVPLPRSASGRVQATIGGFAVDEDDSRRVGVAVALDNLLKGASSQVVQNINRARGLGDGEGLLPPG